MLLTGATGAVGSQIIRKLLSLQQPIRKLVLLVRDQDYRSSLDPQVAEMLNMPDYQGIIHVETIDLREP